MSLALDRTNELAVLMDLRLAFGPGTRLWASRSREELCYDWLWFKSRRPESSFRDFALELLLRETTCTFERRPVCDIRRRVASVLKAHRVEKAARAVVSSPSRPTVHTACHATAGGQSGSQMMATPGPHQPRLGSIHTRSEVTR
jgi:hypothetical protein